MEEKLSLKRNYKSKLTLYVSEENEGKRLDIFLVENLPKISRSCIKKYFEPESQGVILVNSLPKKPHYHLKAGEIVEVTLPEPKPVELEPASINLDIIYEDADILVLNKAPGIPVHPGAGHVKDTIVNALLYYLEERGGLSTIGGEKRPGIVHRLDKDTSGVLVIAKNNPAHEYISRQFALREVQKLYEAVVKGVLIPREGTISKPIVRHPYNRKKFTISETGKEAITDYRVIDSKIDTSWVEFIPKTGRTHQIRVHASSIGHPIIGDPIYSRKANQWVEYIALFAKSVTLIHPKSGERKIFTAPYPEHFKKLLKLLGYTETDLKNSL